MTGETSAHGPARIPTGDRVGLVIYRAATPIDTAGNSRGSKRVAINAIAEHLDCGRRYTTRTNQMQRLFEDTVPKRRER